MVFAELMKHFPVDSFGRGLNYMDYETAGAAEYRGNPADLSLTRQIMARYKFVISHENALIRDYVSEKVFFALQVGVIPVYRGAPNIDRYVPSHSIVHSAAFGSVADLAVYLHALLRDADAWPARAAAGGPTITPVVAADGAGAQVPLPLPFADASFDIVLSSCALHWAGDLPAVFAEVRRVLRPDGLFLGALLGGETLAELRSAFVAAQAEREGGVSPHISPMAGVADVGNLLAGAGFGMPTVDAEPLRVGYPDALRLCEHLQAMGENGAAAQRRLAGRRDTMLAMAAAYQTLYPAPPEEEGEEGGGGGGGGGSEAGGADRGIVATFDVIYWIGWAPAADQPKPLRRGSVAKGFGARGSGPPASS